MKLKDSTFAIIAEKKDSISHKWFNKIAGGILRWDLGYYYIVDIGDLGARKKIKPDNMPIYTESEFEALLKAEQENEAKGGYVIDKQIKFTLNEPKIIKHRYSGKKSQKFWDIVNSIENEADRQEIYSLGVMLQNSEEYVLRQLSNINVCTVTKD